MTTWDMTTIAEKMRSWEPETKDNMNRDGGRVSWVIFGCNLTSTEALPRKPQDEFQPLGEGTGGTSLLTRRRLPGHVNRLHTLAGGKEPHENHRQL